MTAHDFSLDAFDLAPETVQSRFDWAVRQGNARWLWPEIDARDWRNALDQFEAAARRALTGRAPGRALDGEPGAIAVAGYTSGMGPLLGHWIEQGAVKATPAVAGALRYQLRHNRLRMARLTARTGVLLGALTSAGVTPMIVKGMHSAHALFPEPGARPVSDVDLVFAPSEIDSVHGVLRAQGLRGGEPFAGPPPQQEWREPEAPALPRSLSFVHHDDPWAFDIQTGFDRRFAAGGRVVRMDAAIRAAAAPHWPVARLAHVLPQPWLLLYLAVHASNGFETLNLLRLTELVLAARDEALDWDAFDAAAAEAGATGPVYPALFLAEALAPGAIRARTLTRSRAAMPEAGARFVESLTPARAHNLLGQTRAEKFLWSTSRTSQALQLLAEIIPREAAGLSGLSRIYRRRAWKLARGTWLR